MSSVPQQARSYEDFVVRADVAQGEGKWMLAASYWLLAASLCHVTTLKKTYQENAARCVDGANDACGQLPNQEDLQT